MKILHIYSKKVPNREVCDFIPAPLELSKSLNYFTNRVVRLSPPCVCGHTPSVGPDDPLREKWLFLKKFQSPWGFKIANLVGVDMFHVKETSMTQKIVYLELLKSTQYTFRFLLHSRRNSIPILCNKKSFAKLNDIFTPHGRLLTDTLYQHTKNFHSCSGVREKTKPYSLVLGSYQ